MRPRVLSTATVPLDEIVRECVRVLRQGRLVALPTDTVYGVAVAADDPGALKRIYAAKLRDPGKPVAILASDLDAVARFGAEPGERERRLAERFWPGPLTLIMRTADGVDEGFRVPDHATALAVIRGVGGCLRVTSANRSGMPDARTARAAAEALGDALELVVDDGPAPGGVPSSVVRVDGGRVVVLREGALSRFVLQRAAESDGRGGDDMRKGRLVVFVCTANMCRSPMAENLFMAAPGRDASWMACSAGTDAGEGLPATQQAVLAMRDIGIDMTGHRSRPLTRELVDLADLVVVMTEGHASRILWRFPDSGPKVRLLKSFVKKAPGEDCDVPDPIGLSGIVYDGIRDMMAEAMPGIVDVLRGMDEDTRKG